MESDPTALLLGLKSVHLTQLLVASLLGLVAWAAAMGLDHGARLATSWMPGHRLTVFRIHTIGRFLVYLGAALAISAALLSSKPELMVALFGSAAVAVGFSLKDVAASLFAGLVLLFDQPFQVGDRVSYREHYGDIVSIGLRSVRILTLGHDTVTIPNSAFLTEAVASGNSGSLAMMVSVTMYVGVSADIHKAMELMREVVVTSRYAWLKNGVSITLSEEVGETLRPGLALVARCYIVDFQLEKPMATDIVLRTTLAWREAGIVRFEQGSLD
ncbi:mechanosensitive ion channel [bacterium]|nr:mechanosensitive ion channel [bacterium]